MRTRASTAEWRANEANRGDLDQKPTLQEVLDCEHDHILRETLAQRPSQERSETRSCHPAEFVTPERECLHRVPRCILTSISA
jgi:hypothetical protein